MQQVAITTRRAFIGAPVAIGAMGSTLPAEALRRDGEWSAFAKALAILHPRGAEAVLQAASAGLDLRTLNFMIVGTAGEASRPRLMFKGEDGEIRIFDPAGELKP